MTKLFFNQNIFLNKIFLWAKTFLTRIFFYHEFCLTKFFLSQIFLPKFFFYKIFFFLQNFFITKYFFTENFFHQNFLPPNFFKRHFFYWKFFSTNIIFAKKIFTKTFFDTKKIIFNRKWFFQIFKLKQLVLTLKQLNLVLCFFFGRYPLATFILKEIIHKPTKVYAIHTTRKYKLYSAETNLLPMRVHTWWVRKRPALYILVIILISVIYQVPLFPNIHM